MAASGAFYFAFGFDLLGGAGFVYPVGPFPDPTTASIFANSFQTFVNPDGLTGYYGEWFNYVARGSVIDKVTTANLPDWLLAH